MIIHLYNKCSRFRRRGRGKGRLPDASNGVIPEIELKPPFRDADRRRREREQWESEERERQQRKQQEEDERRKRQLEDDERDRERLR